MGSVFDQSTYQVRFDWGNAAVSRLAPSDVMVVVDVLRFTSTATETVTESAGIDLADAVAWSSNGAAVALAATRHAPDAVVLLGCLRNADAVAAAIQSIQERRGRRTSVSIIAAGEVDESGGLRFAVEDQLGAGAIIAALGDRGIDHTSPEAAATGEAFRGLRRGLRHLISASGSGRQLEAPVASDRPMVDRGIVAVTVEEAAERDVSRTVPVVVGGTVRAWSED